MQIECNRAIVVDPCNELESWLMMFMGVKFRGAAKG